METDDVNQMTDDELYPKAILTRQSTESWQTYDKLETDKIILYFTFLTKKDEFNLSLQFTMLKNILT